MWSTGATVGGGCTRMNDVDLSHLSLTEKEAILQVIKRDEALRKMEERRILHLKAELQRLRKRGALRPGLDPARSCGRCLAALGRIMNRGAPCPVCHKKVCRDCRLYEPEAQEGSQDWLCVVCQKQMELKATSGQWMQDLCRRSSRRRKLNDPPVTQVIERALSPPPSQGPNTPETSEHAPSPATTPVLGRFQSPSSSSTPQPSHDNPRRFLADSPRSLRLQDSCSSEPPDEDYCTGPRSRTPPRLPSQASSPGSVRWAPLRAPLRKMPHQTSLSSSSDSLSAESPVHVELPTTPASKPTDSADRCSPSAEKVPPVPFPRTKRQARSPDKGSPSPELTRSLQQQLPLPKLPVALSLSAPASPAFKQRSRSALTVTYSSPPSVGEDGDAQGVPRGVRKGTAPELGDLHKAKDVVFRRVTLSKSHVDQENNPDDSSGSHRSSPRGRLRVRGRHSSGGSDDSARAIPVISVANEEGSLSRASIDSTCAEGLHDERLDSVYPSCSRSQTSLSSIAPSRSESMTSVYSAAGRYGTVVVTGEALFNLVYNPKSGMLEVHVKQCRGLAPVDTKKNRSDPYVKVYLLPDRTKSGKRKTKVKKNNLNPVFDEVLKFRVTMSELQARVLWLSVWHSDIFGRNDFLGEVMLQLNDRAFKQTDAKWYPLQERRESLEMPLSYKGDLLLSLKYMPPDVTNWASKLGSLHVLVKEARNLMATRSNGTADPFCKSYLLPDRSKSGKQKTPVMKKTCNPKWNHTFVYKDVSLDTLKDRCLELTLWDYDKYISNDFLGGVRLGIGTGRAHGADVDWMDSQGEEVVLWRTMLEKPNTWVEGTLQLRPNLTSKR